MKIRQTICVLVLFGEEIAFLQIRAADAEGARRIINVQRGRTANANLAHLACHQRGVGADSPACGENAFGGEHAADIFRRGFRTH